MDFEELVFQEMQIGTTETMIATVDKDLVALWAQDLARKMVLCAAMLEMAKTSSRFLFIPLFAGSELKA